MNFSVRCDQIIMGSSKNVIPAKAGIKNQPKLLDSRLRGSDRLAIIRGTLMLTTHYSAQKYPEPLRRIRFYDSERQKRLVFLTNNFELPAETIARLYKARWHIELFFKLDNSL